MSKFLSRAALILHNAQKVIQQRRTENEEDFDPSSSDMAIARSGQPQNSKLRRSTRHRTVSRRLLMDQVI